MGFSTTVNFKSNATFPTNATFPELRFLNAQKLSLPANTPVGTQVAVTDGFVVSDPNGPDNAYPSIGGFYLQVGSSGGKHSYNLLGLLDTESKIQWNGFSWLFNDIGAVGVYSSDDDVEEPWLVTTWVIEEGHTSLPTLTHPALQQLTAPATAQGGVFVAGGSQDGVYVINGSNSGKPEFALVGTDLTNSAIEWTTAPPRWEFYVPEAATGDLTYYSLSDVATPDVATNWKNASDDSPASITVTSVTTGQLVSGWKLGSVVYQVNGTQNGRNLYRDVLGVAPNIGWDSTKWTDGTTNGSGNTAFPDIGMADPVASEANWTNI